MNVLVTGAAGFLASYVIPDLQATGATVWALDLPTKAPPFKPMDGPLRWVSADITRPLDLALPDLDCVIHLAAIAAPGQCEADPVRAFAVNVAGTYHVLKLAKANGARRFVNLSSAHVYGISPRYWPTDESHPLWALDTYTVSKQLGERLCELFHDNRGISYCTLRLFNGYGPGQSPDYFIPAMIQKAKTGTIELRGRKITKDFVYAGDVARAVVLAAKSEFVGPINIGTGRETQLEYVAASVALALGADLTFADSDGAGPTRMCADAARAKRVLGWTPEVSLDEGLARTIEAMR